MVVCIDGNDGVGKTTIISLLKDKYPEIQFQDRGLPTKLTVGEKGEKADLTIILTCSPEISYKRLYEAGRDMNEHWHKLSTLKHYHNEFYRLAINNAWYLVDTESSIENVFKKICYVVDNAHSM